MAGERMSGKGKHINSLNNKEFKYLKKAFVCNSHKYKHLVTLPGK